MQTQTPLQHNRIGSLICIAGVVLIVLGFFMPLYTMQDAGSGTMHYMSSFYSSGLFVLSSPFALIVLVTSIAALFGVRWPGLVYQRRVAAIAGLLVQALVDALAMMGEMFCIGGTCPVTQPSMGMYWASFGFVVMLMGAFVARRRRYAETQEAADPTI